MGHPQEQDFNVRLEESQFIVPIFRRLPCTKVSHNETYIRKKKRSGYDENSHKHYNAKVFLFIGFLELEESHLKSFRVQIDFACFMDLLSHQRSMSACFWMLCAFLLL